MGGLKIYPPLSRKVTTTLGNVPSSYSVHSEWTRWTYTKDRDGGRRPYWNPTNGEGHQSGRDDSFLPEVASRPRQPRPLLLLARSTWNGGASMVDEPSTRRVRRPRRGQREGRSSSGEEESLRYQRGVPRADNDLPSGGSRLPPSGPCRGRLRRLRPSVRRARSGRITPRGKRTPSAPTGKGEGEGEDLRDALGLRSRQPAPAPPHSGRSSLTRPRPPLTLRGHRPGSPRLNPSFTPPLLPEGPNVYRPLRYRRPAGPREARNGAS